MLWELFYLPNKKCSNERTTRSEMDVAALPGATEYLKGSIENIELVLVAWSCKWRFWIPNFMDNWVVLAEAWIWLSATVPKRWSPEVSGCHAFGQTVVETEDGGHHCKEGWSVESNSSGSEGRVRIPLQDLFSLEDAVNIKIVLVISHFNKFIYLRYWIKSFLLQNDHSPVSNKL